MSLPRRAQAGCFDAFDQAGPGSRHDVEAPLGLLRVAVVRGQAEPDPGPGLPLRAPMRVAHLLQDLVVGVCEPADELRHQSGNVPRVRCGVGGDEGGVRAGDVDGAVTPAAGALVEVVALQHEVQAVEQTGVVAEVVTGVGEIRMNLT